MCNPSFFELPSETWIRDRHTNPSRPSFIAPPRSRPIQTSPEPSPSTLPILWHCGLDVLCSPIACEHDLRLGLGGGHCQDQLLVRSGVAMPSCISNPPNILIVLTTTVTSATLFQRDIQMHISKTRTWSWAWGILKIYRLKIVSLKFCKKEETLRKCATMKKIHSFGYLFINI